MFYRKFGMIFQDIILIGAGGTGSRVVAPLIQTIKQAQRAINPMLTIVDGDVFEESNLIRQNCIRKDMGRNKAVVMAERYGAALDFPVVACTDYITPDYEMVEQLSGFARQQGRRNLLDTRKLYILCVDSIQARIDILSNISPNDVVIDCGNEDTFGQVSIFDNTSFPLSVYGHQDTLEFKPFSNDIEIPILPSTLTTYLDAIGRPSQATRSCADLDQSLAINNLMAAGAINKVQNLVYDNPFYTRTDYFDLIKGNSSERLTNIWLNQVVNESIPEDFYGLGDKASYITRRNKRYLDIPSMINALEEQAEYVDPRLLALLK